jgi:hypothetical protein
MRYIRWIANYNHLSNILVTILVFEDVVLCRLKTTDIIWSSIQFIVKFQVTFKLSDQKCFSANFERALILYGCCSKNCILLKNDYFLFSRIFLVYNLKEEGRYKCGRTIVWQMLPSFKLQHF